MTSPPRSSEAHALGAADTFAQSAADALAQSAADARVRRVGRLLDELGADLRRGQALAAATERCATGLPHVDRLLDGGLPRGRLSEIAGPFSSGRTSLALSLLARTTAAGHWVAAIDAADAFDPASAAAAGVALERVLWVRPTSPRDALRSVEHVLTTRGFALIALDLALPALPGSGVGRQEAIPSAAWSRLRKLTAGTDTALLVLGCRRIAGSFADLAVEMENARPRFTHGPDWLEGMEGRIRLVRNRTGPAQRIASVRWQTAA